MDKRTWQVAGSLFVILPLLWGALGAAKSVYDEWISTRSRIEKLERWRCAVGSRPPESLDWKRKMSECRDQWGERD